MIPAQEPARASSLRLRPYLPDDEDTAIALWQRTWQQAYPHIDFAARVAWWRERWRTELVPVCVITVAMVEDAMAGFVTVDPKTGYLDQLVVAPEAWGSGAAAALIAAAKAQSPDGPRSARQSRQRPRHPLLREARLRRYGRGDQPALRRTDLSDELAGVGVVGAQSEACPRGPDRESSMSDLILRSAPLRASRRMAPHAAARGRPSRRRAAHGSSGRGRQARIVTATRPARSTAPVASRAAPRPGTR